jgi:NAD(P)-dependent dehydrogenase (short-subunit alcohol dehydrogenase family)
MTKSVVITGVSTGIGLETARDLVAHGYRVFGSVRKETDGARVRADLGEAFMPLLFDVTDAAAMAAAVDIVHREVGDRGLTALINNAGINSMGPLMHVPLDEVRRIFEVNVVGVIAVTQAFLPLLGARRDALHRPGRIVNMSSVSGGVAAPASSRSARATRRRKDSRWLPHRRHEQPRRA